MCTAARDLAITYTRQRRKTERVASLDSLLPLQPQPSSNSPSSTMSVSKEIFGDAETTLKALDALELGLKRLRQFGGHFHSPKEKTRSGSSFWFSTPEFVTCISRILHAYLHILYLQRPRVGKYQEQRGRCYKTVSVDNPTLQACVESTLGYVALFGDRNAQDGVKHATSCPRTWCQQNSRRIACGDTL